MMKDCIMLSGELRPNLLLMKVTWTGRYTKVASTWGPLYGNPHPTSFPGSQSSVRIAASKFLEFGVVDWWSQTKPERPDGEQLISQFGCIFSVCIWILFVFVSFAALTLFHRLCLTA